MRAVKVIAPALAVVMLSAAGLAYASSQFTQTSKITLTATKANKPTGLKASLQSSDPRRAPAAGAQDAHDHAADEDQVQLQELCDQAVQGDRHRNQGHGRSRLSLQEHHQDPARPSPTAPR